MSASDRIDRLRSHVPGDPGLGTVVAALGVLLGAMVVGVYTPRTLSLPYLEPVLLVAAIALVGYAAVSRRSRAVQRAYRRTVWVAAGLFAGWWLFAVQRPESPAPFVVVIVAWSALGAIEAERQPSLSWAVGIVSSLPAGATLWFLLARIEVYGSKGAFLVEVLSGSGQARRYLLEAAIPILLVGIPFGIVAYLLGRGVHDADGLRPNVRIPSPRTVVLLIAAFVSFLYGAAELRLI